MTSSDLKEWCALHGVEQLRMTTDDFARFVTSEAERAGAIIRKGPRTESPNALSSPLSGRGAGPHSPLPRPLDGQAGGDPGRRRRVPARPPGLVDRVNGGSDPC